MSIPQIFPSMVAVGVGIAIAVPLHRALRRASPTVNLAAAVIVGGILLVAVLVVLAR
jgi:hypothetical protein